MISQLFKEKTTEKSPEKIFYLLMEKYKQEQINAEKELTDTKNILNAEINESLDVEILTCSLIMSLIERIKVSDKFKKAIRIICVTL